MNLLPRAVKADFPELGVRLLHHNPLRGWLAPHCGAWGTWGAEANPRKAHAAGSSV